jgi:hypothetical protein
MIKDKIDAEGHTPGPGSILPYDKRTPYQVDKMSSLLESLIKNLRAESKTLKEPKAQALFETSAEVLTGLKTAFKHYKEAAD